MTDDTCCYLCEGTQETILHMLHDCGFVKAIWLKLFFMIMPRVFLS